MAIPATPAARSTSVLLVDDQPIIGEAVRRMLAGEEGIAFHYCRDATAALERAAEVGPTVILQDLVMDAAPPRARAPCPGAPPPPPSHGRSLVDPW